MKKAYYKIVEQANFAELWSCRLPDFKAKREMTNTARQGIAAAYAGRRDSNGQFRYYILATAETEKHAAYLEKRGYTTKKWKLPKGNHYDTL